MILENYAKYLQSADSNICATDILARWLWEKLSLPPETSIDQVLHCELRLLRVSSTDSHNLFFQLASKD